MRDQEPWTGTRRQWALSVAGALVMVLCAWGWLVVLTMVGS